ncbi:MAG: glycerol-3-phosphate 1-O-acyltransferase PlsY [Ruminococcus sp.]|nr:glycerol-3-phosphate 1-O-acyltransferase PlsY [Ruminococcus sp.]MBQ3915771.1 glycerol-3-phosphate 1-O-acyltransferase PlsY [Ruminococcus sp.]
MLAVILAAILGYMLGSLNFAIIVVKIITGKDIRTMGSKNGGLTNTYRCCGAAPAVLTLIGDLSKGVMAVAASRTIAYGLEAGLSPDNDTHYIGYVAGLFAVIGHIFPAYFQFRGGKGVLVGVASFLMVDPKVFVALLAIFIVIVALSHYVSVGSIISAAYCPLATLLMSWLVDGDGFSRSLLYMVLSIPMAVIVIWMHRTNIQRLRDGNENKFSFKRAA